MTSSLVTGSMLQLCFALAFSGDTMRWVLSEVEGDVKGL